jgi:hypothetical protein
MRAYSLLLIKTCHRRGIHAMGGMAAQIPVKNNPQANEAALQKVWVPVPLCYTPLPPKRLATLFCQAKRTAALADVAPRRCTQCLAAFSLERR